MPGDSQIVTLHQLGGAKLWSTESGEFVREFGQIYPAFNASFDGFAMSPDGERIATARNRDSEHGFVEWNIASGSQSAASSDFPRNTYDCAYSADGGSLFVAGARLVREWDVMNDVETRKRGLRSNDLMVKAIAANANGKHLLTGGWHRTGSVVTLWNLEHNAQEFRWASDELVFDVEFTPDGRLAIGAFSDAIYVWDIASGDQVRRIDRGDGRSVAVDPNSRYLAVAWRDTNEEEGGVGVWSLESGEHVRTLLDDRPVNSVAYSPDGRQILSGHGYGRIQPAKGWLKVTPFESIVIDSCARLWDVDSGDLLLEFGEPVAIPDESSK